MVAPREPQDAVRNIRLYPLSALKSSGRGRKPAQQRDIEFHNVEAEVVSTVLANLRHQAPSMVDVEPARSPGKIRLFVYADDIAGVAFCSLGAERVVRSAVSGTNISVVTPR